MSETNGKKGFDALLTLLTNPIGRFIGGAIIFALTFAYNTGVMRTQIAELSKRITTLEAKVDTLIRTSSATPTIGP